MYAKGKSSNVPSDSQAREKLALYVYEYLLHVGAQKSAQTFLSEIRWEKNITLGEPPGFLHSWWCVFWDLYCAAPERRDTCEHSSEAKAFHDYSAAAAPSPVLGNLPPGEGMPVGPVPPGFFQPFMSPRYPGGPRPPLRLPNQGLGGVPGSQPMLPSGIDPTRQQELWGWNETTTKCPGWTWDAWNEHTPYSSASPGSYVGPPGGGGPPGTPIMPSPAGSGDMDSLPKNSPGNLSMNNQPGTPREDGEMGGNFLNPFQSESVIFPEHDDERLKAPHSTFAKSLRKMGGRSLETQRDRM
ncbi:hypothetical protein fugu_003706 [Takifugu bimaculatus]|uniref:Uncharacterized protein n=1 Tax=Takifugu bimaculatus TaxID=433685 RepID=A0A4Z2BBD8_9TELE|nr:hypothetical protein fugu_003706 [Takifugu bimaculatus]